MSLNVQCLVAQLCLTLCDPHGQWGFSRQEYWSGLPCPPPGDRPNPEIEPRSPALQVDYLPSTTETPGKPKNLVIFKMKQNVKR